jgi:hypothetical protein
MLRRCGLGETWYSWIVFCISLVCFSVLVNGSLVCFISSFRGFRQGDPLFLFLFVIVMEVLSNMITTTVDRGLLLGFSVGSRPPAVNISHLLFADDTLIFCGANPNHLRHLCALLLCFEAAFGLKVNLAKSVLVSVGNVDNMDKLVGILGCEISSLPLKYLCIPLGASYLQGKVYLGWYCGKVGASVGQL